MTWTRNAQTTLYMLVHKQEQGGEQGYHVQIGTQHVWLSDADADDLARYMLFEGDKNGDS